MKVKSEDMLLYAVTDRYWLKDDTLENQVDKILASGATFLQLREKNISTEEYIAIAKSVKKIADKYAVPFVIMQRLLLRQMPTASISVKMI